MAVLLPVRGAVGGPLAAATGVVPGDTPVDDAEEGGVAAPDDVLLAGTSGDVKGVLTDTGGGEGACGSEGEDGSIVTFGRGGSVGSRGLVETGGGGVGAWIGTVPTVGTVGTVGTLGTVGTGRAGTLTGTVGRVGVEIVAAAGGAVTAEVAVTAGTLSPSACACMGIAS